MKYSISQVNDSDSLERYNELLAELKLDLPDSRSSECMTWLISDNSANAVLGYINLFQSSDAEPEIGFALIGKAQRIGIMSEVLPAFVKQLNRILYTETAVQNIGAIKVLHKAGFISCGPLHPTHLTPYGELVHTAAFRYQPEQDSN